MALRAIIRAVFAPALIVVHCISCRKLVFSQTLFLHTHCRKLFFFFIFQLGHGQTLLLHTHCSEHILPIKVNSRFFRNFSSQEAADTMRIHVTKYNALQEKMHKMKMHWSHNATITGHKKLHEGSQKTTNKDQFIGNWANGGRKRR